ncbi:protein-methionine-sulfoxide reductase catalytic subunit MsrP [Shewanella marina]|uniref:protein-methionine-sulfoxide reductase catalytic subunit MsrP n=1 Tax=Shewanella marina TaxID=487319 RepID=UPI0004724852|nr:protein-methionine-sulfoxide reductase catalytic subunit MsrP [Shewanella marina]
MNKKSKQVVIPQSWNEADKQLTSEAVFKQRRNILSLLGLTAVSTSLPGAVQAGIFDLFDDEKVPVVANLNTSINTQFNGKDVLTPLAKVTTHNNFYEFGTAKTDPSENAKNFNGDPWTLTVSGLVDKPITLGYDDLYKIFALEQRNYRLRCVEAWSMVIPWDGFSLATLLSYVGVNNKAKYVAFETRYDPEIFPGQKNKLLGGGIHYPYVEGLTIEEAMNPLTFMAVGLYGNKLLGQNGAPIRLVVPWKYGFKSIKSIAHIRLVDKQPPTSWNQLAPHEYGFYANVNPQVDHPRWSQASERRIGPGGLFSTKRIPTQMFNGYGEWVADLYQNIDLTRNF